MPDAGLPHCPWARIGAQGHATFGQLPGWQRRLLGNDNGPLGTAGRAQPGCGLQLSWNLVRNIRNDGGDRVLTANREYLWCREGAHRVALASGLVYVDFHPV